MPLKEIISAADFRRQIKKSVSRGYLFFGEEDYMKAHSLRLLRSTVCGEDSAGSLNNIRLTPLEYSPQKLAEAIPTLPIFGERKLIEISGLNFKELRAADLDALLSVLPMLDEYDYNTLVITVPDGGIDAGRPPRKPSAIISSLAEYLTPVYFDRSTPSQLADWTEKHFSHNGVTAPAEVCSKMIEYCGRDMYTLAGEIDKVSYYVLAAGRREVTADDIVKAAIPDSDYDAFAFANALIAGDRPRALAILSLMKERKIEPVMIMSEVSRVFCDMAAVRALAAEGCRAREIALGLKMHEYRAGLYLSAVASASAQTLSRLIALAAEADASIKLSPRGYSAIEFLICSI